MFDEPTFIVMFDLLNVYVLTLSIRVPLTSTSLIPILLSRFIINLRQVGTSATIPSDNRHPSRFSIPNLRMPTLDGVVGNFGEPLDFVEYRIEDDEDGEHDAAVQIDEENSNAAHQDVENAFEPALADVERRGRLEVGAAVLQRS